MFQLARQSRGDSYLSYKVNVVGMMPLVFTWAHSSFATREGNVSGLCPHGEGNLMASPSIFSLFPSFDQRVTLRTPQMIFVFAVADVWYAGQWSTAEADHGSGETVAEMR